MWNSSPSRMYRRTMATLRWRVCCMMSRSVAPPVAAEVARPARRLCPANSKQLRVRPDGHNAALDDQGDAATQRPHWRRRPPRWPHDSQAAYKTAVRCEEEAAQRTGQAGTALALTKARMVFEREA